MAYDNDTVVAQVQDLDNGVIVGHNEYRNRINVFLQKTYNGGEGNGKRIQFSLARVGDAAGAAEVLDRIILGLQETRDEVALL